MTDRIELEIYGTPHAAMRPRGTAFRARDGRIRSRSYTPRKEHQEQKTILVQIIEQRPSSPLLGPLHLAVSFGMPRTQDHYRSGRFAGDVKENAPFLHSKKPDLDNLLKTVMDAMSRGQFWRDDAQVSKITATKYYSDTPMTHVTVSKIKSII